MIALYYVNSEVENVVAFKRLNKLFGHIVYHNVPHVYLKYFKLVVIFADSIEEGIFLLSKIGGENYINKIIYLDSFSVDDKISALNAGFIDCFDGYMSAREVLSKVKVYFRIRIQSLCDNSISTFDFYSHLRTELDIMTYVEKKIVLLLFFNFGKLIDKKYLLLYIRDFCECKKSRTVDSHVININKKLSKNKITTIHSVGIKLT